MFQHQFNFLYNLYVTSRASSCNYQSVNSPSIVMLIEGEPVVLQLNMHLAQNVLQTIFSIVFIVVQQECSHMGYKGCCTPNILLVDTTFAENQ